MPKDEEDCSGLNNRFIHRLGQLGALRPNSGERVLKIGQALNLPWIQLQKKEGQPLQQSESCFPNPAEA